MQTVVTCAGVEGLPSFRCGQRRDRGSTDDEVEDKKRRANRIRRLKIYVWH